MQRKKHSAAFKAKVALEAIKENRTSAELSSAYGVHTTMITRWKRQVLEHLPEVFSDKVKRKDKNNEELLASLYQQIGQLKVELDWLKKKSELLK
jgi:transposase-like protein